MRKSLARVFFICGGVVAGSTLINPSHHVPAPLHATVPTDPRLARLTEFFQRFGSPVAGMAHEFLSASDRYNLDWRLLPSISFVESGGGKRCKGNNIFGWDSGEQVFASIREGIHLVAGRLANSKLYRGKDLPSALETYNGNADYADLVQSVMRRVDPSEPPALRSRRPVGAYSSIRTPK
jgi:hypothetical protein